MATIVGQTLGVEYDLVVASLRLERPTSGQGRLGPTAAAACHRRGARRRRGPVLPDGGRGRRRGRRRRHDLAGLARVVRVPAVAVAVTVPAPVALQRPARARAPCAVPVARLLRDALGRHSAGQFVAASLRHSVRDDSDRNFSSKNEGEKQQKGREKNQNQSHIPNSSKKMKNPTKIQR